ncbi:MAG: carbon dioxide concentrating mechanism protein [Leptolyngbya sp. SIO1E4]|nr:carbon dioxide concentrating mechanism protein [Leptolyngbya sp. SIO1E4]
MRQQDDVSDAIAYYVGDAVVVSSDVVIASGSVLEAVPGSRLVVGPGVCIGAGVVIQAYGGELKIEAGTNLGRGVLLLGAGVVGTRACIGAESTLINPNVQADQVIAARSLVGDMSRALAAGATPTPKSPSQNGKTPHPADAVANADTLLDSPDVDSPNGNGQAGSLASMNSVYGRDQVLQLVQILFPHRNAVMSDSNSP